MDLPVDKILHQSMAIARTFAAANAHRLRAWLSGQRIGAAHAGFMRTDEDLVVSCGPLFIEKEGSSGSVAAALAMCQLIHAYRFNGVPAVTGDLDLRGNLKPVEDLRVKLHEAKRAGATLFVYPQECRSRLEREWAVSVNLSFPRIDGLIAVRPVR